MHISYETLLIDCLLTAYCAAQHVHFTMQHITMSACTTQHSAAQHSTCTTQHMHSTCTAPHMHSTVQHSTAHAQHRPAGGQLGVWAPPSNGVNVTTPAGNVQHGPLGCPVWSTAVHSPRAVGPSLTRRKRNHSRTKRSGRSPRLPRVVHSPWAVGPLPHKA